MIYTLAGLAVAGRLLQAGDTLEMTCPEAPWLCLRRTLSPIGDLFLPGVPPIHLAKVSTEDAPKEIAQALENCGAVPEAHIQVRIVPGLNRTVTISGLVAQPGQMTVGMRGISGAFLGPSVTLQDLLSTARTAPDADLRHIQITAIDGTEFVADATARSWTLRPGDRVEVPRTAPQSEIILLGGVQQPGFMPFEEGMTVAQAVSQAGGVSALGTSRGWKVIHEGEIAEPLADARVASAFTLRPGDTIEVPYQVVPPYAVVIGAVAQPTGVTLEHPVRLTQAIKAAGGATADGDLTHVLIRPANGKAIRMVDFTSIGSSGPKGSNRGTDPLLAAGDSVIVPRLRVKAGP